MPRFIEKPMHKYAGWRLPLCIFEGEIAGDVLTITAPEELAADPMRRTVFLTDSVREALTTKKYPTVLRDCLIEIPPGSFGPDRFLTFKEWSKIMDYYSPELVAV